MAVVSRAFSFLRAPGSAGRADVPLKGLGLACASYALYAAQDAMVKWLVADTSAFEILFVRSLAALALALGIGRGPAVRTLAASPNKRALAGRAGLVVVAWVIYYATASRLGLAEMTTLYFVAPVITVLLSVVVLRERVDAARWGAVLLGFAGVAVAARPGGSVPPGPALAVLLAAAVWALCVILIRTISRVETTMTQVLVTNAAFVVACGAALPWTWTTPDARALALMVGTGLAGGCGQFLLYEGYRLAPASAVAPVEYTGLLWAFALAYLIWGEVPSAQVWVGAAAILAAGLGLVWSTARAERGAPADG